MGRVRAAFEGHALGLASAVILLHGSPVFRFGGTVKRGFHFRSAAVALIQCLSFWWHDADHASFGAPELTPLRSRERL